MLLISFTAREKFTCSISIEEGQEGDGEEGGELRLWRDRSVRHYGFGTKLDDPDWSFPELGLPGNLLQHHQFRSFGQCCRQWLHHFPSKEWNFCGKQTNTWSCLLLHFYINIYPSAWYESLDIIWWPKSIFFFKKNFLSSFLLPSMPLPLLPSPSAAVLPRPYPHPLPTPTAHVRTLSALPRTFAVPCVVPPRGEEERRQRVGRGHEYGRGGGARVVTPWA